MMFVELGCNYVGECMQIWQDSSSNILSSRIATIKTKLPKILEACNSNARGIEQLNAHVELFMIKLLAQSNAGLLGASLTSQGSIAGTIELATHTVEVQTTAKCIELGEGHGIECPIEMQPSIKPIRLLKGMPLKTRAKLNMGILAILQRCTFELSFTDEN
jgi:hypothetical protein